MYSVFEQLRYCGGQLCQPCGSQWHLAMQSPSTFYYIYLMTLKDSSALQFKKKIIHDVSKDHLDMGSCMPLEVKLVIFAKHLYWFQVHVAAYHRYSASDCKFLHLRETIGIECKHDNFSNVLLLFSLLMIYLVTVLIIHT